MSNLLQPYRSIGQFIDSNMPHNYFIGKHEYLACSTSHSFKIFKLPELKVKFLGPNLEHKVRAIVCYNEYAFVASGTQIFKFHFYHLVSTYSVHKEKITCMTIVGDIIMSGDRSGKIFLLNASQHSDPIAQLQVGFIPKMFLHPPTYLNKLLILGDEELQLWNVRSGKMIYNFTESSHTLGKILEAGIQEEETSKTTELRLGSNLIAGSEENQTSLQIYYIANSPALDIISIALSDGRVLLMNLKEDRIVHKFKVKDYRVTSMTFSNLDLPLVACGTEQGEIIVWDLNNEKILSRIKNAHGGYVSYLQFARDELLLYSGSASENSVKQWKYDEAEDSMFYLLRERSGLTGSIKKLRFYGEEGYHVMVSSLHEKAEIRDFFIMNETFKGDFSLRENKKLTKQKTNTESLIEISQITDFGFAHNRAKDWANILSCHKGSNKPFFWSSENHALVHQNVKWESEDIKDTKAIISKVHVSNCGNFGFLGYTNGKILKINMQSGTKQTYFYVENTATLPFSLEGRQQKIHEAAISGILSDTCNKFLISTDTEGSLAQWDFYSGNLMKCIDISPKQIVVMRNSSTSSLLGLAYDDYSIELFDISTLRKGRGFVGHTARVTDFCFTVNNKNLISAGMDRTLKVWDIIYSSIISNFILKEPIVSVDIDPSGEFIATAFLNSKEIHLWNNNIGKAAIGDQRETEISFVSEIKDLPTENERAKYFSAVGTAKKEEKSNISEGEFDELKKFFSHAANKNETKRELKEKQKMMQLEEQDIGKWLPLIHFDLIKEKNKPKEAVDQNVSAPFFLDFHPERQSLFEKKVEGNLEEAMEVEKDKQVKSKVIKKHHRNELLDQVGSPIERLFKKVETGEEADILNELYREMKALNPAQLDYEVRKITFGDIVSVRKFLWLFCYLFKVNQRDYDLKQIYLYTFINACYDMIANDTELKILLEQLSKHLNESYEHFDQNLNGTICLIETFAKIKN